MYKIFVAIKIIIVSFLNAEIYRGEIIAKIGDDIIFKEDVIERAEYTPRPLYCRGNSSIDKKIIINTLIGEKLFSKEWKEFNTSINVENYLIGRKNQKMRDLLFYEIIKKDSINYKKYSHWYKFSDFKYDIQYLSITDVNSIEKVKELISLGFNLSDIYKEMVGNEKTLPTRESITMFNLNNIALRESLYEKKLYPGDLVGPIKTDDNIYMFYEILDFEEVINLSQNNKEIVYNQISELIARQSNEKFYKNFVKEIMTGLSFTLNAKQFKLFSKYVKSWYQEEQLVSFNKSKNNIEENLQSEILLELNNHSISIQEVLEWIKVHPLEFRKGYYEKMPFEVQLKYSLADLIRDKELNKVAIDRDLNNHPIVINEYRMWQDNYKAMKMRDNIIGNVELSSANVPKELNSYFNHLTKKYSDQIWINVEAVESLSLSSIDMFVLNDKGPYEINTPIFPIITSHHQFDYGRILE